MKGGGNKDLMAGGLGVGDERRKSISVLELFENYV
jgi:hypothetical protein